MTKTSKYPQHSREELEKLNIDQPLLRLVMVNAIEMVFPFCIDSDVVVLLRLC